MPATLDRGFNITALIGAGGDGKSYIVTHDLAFNRLVKFDFNLVTNLPLRVKELAAFVAEQRECTPEEIEKRIHIIDQDQLTAWKKGEGGPWDMQARFEDLHETTGQRTDFILDEIHLFCPKKRNKRENDWGYFLGEARHMHLQRVQFITQDPDEVSSLIYGRCHAKYELEKGDRRRTKPLGIPMSYIYETIASITGNYQPIVYRTEYIKKGGKLTQNHEDAFGFDKRIFSLYDSHSAAGGASEAGETDRKELQEYQKRPRLLPCKYDYNQNGKPVLTLPTWLWAFTNNPLPVAKVSSIILFIAFVNLGGIGYAFNLLQYQLNSTIKTMVPGNVESTIDPVPRDPVSTTVVATTKEDCGCGSKRQLIKDMAKAIETSGMADGQTDYLLAITPDAVSFAHGLFYHHGDTIERGDFKGKKILRIDYPKRRVLISGGVNLRLQSSEDLPQEANAEVRELLQRVAEIDKPDTDYRRERSILVDRNDGDVPQQALVDARQGDRL